MCHFLIRVCVLHLQPAKVRLSMSFLGKSFVLIILILVSLQNLFSDIFPCLLFQLLCHLLLFLMILLYLQFLGILRVNFLTPEMVWYNVQFKKKKQKKDEQMTLFLLLASKVSIRKVKCTTGVLYRLLVVDPFLTGEKIEKYIVAYKTIIQGVSLKVDQQAIS